LSGAQTAAPIWAEFMKKAVALPRYEDAKSFSQPQGVIDVQLDKITNRLATPTCPDDYTIAFVAGTEPHDTCDQTGGAAQGFFSRIFGGNSEKALPPPTTNGNPDPASGVQSQEEAKKKKGFFGKIAGVFKADGSGRNDKTPPPPSTNGDNGAPPQ
jgi:penicillin-binding protein 1B